LRSRKKKEDLPQRHRNTEVGKGGERNTRHGDGRPDVLGGYVLVDVDAGRSKRLPYGHGKRVERGMAT
jgi:hypothetical protein